MLTRLKKVLANWRVDSKDPLLDRGKMLRLKAEIEACQREGVFEKKWLKLNYPEYFFSE